MTSVVVLDYGSGNIRSAERALARAGATVTVTADFDAALWADGLVVPGVGAFQACMEGLLSVRGDQLIERRLASARPVLGICVGMQILFGSGIEHGVETKGCDRWPGVVERLQPGAEPVPHMGWNRVEVDQGSRLFRGIEDERFYFVHSYAVRSWTPQPTTTVAWTPYGDDRFLAAVEDGPLTATQFHPEKSGDTGATLLKNWIATI